MNLGWRWQPPVKLLSTQTTAGFIAPSQNLVWALQGALTMILKQNSSRLRSICSKLVLTLQHSAYWQQSIRADLCHSQTDSTASATGSPAKSSVSLWSSSLLYTLCSQTSWNSILATGVTHQVSDPYKTTGKISFLYFNLYYFSV
jgi:hypothetical protein